MPSVMAALPEITAECALGSQREAYATVTVRVSWVG
jgi:hypothetical protein